MRLLCWVVVCAGLAISPGCGQKAGEGSASADRMIAADGAQDVSGATTEAAFPVMDAAAEFQNADAKAEPGGDSQVQVDGQFLPDERHGQLGDADAPNDQGGSLTDGGGGLEAFDGSDVTPACDEGRIRIAGKCIDAASAQHLLTAGDEHSCAVRNGGTVWCWGDNSSGQLGNGTSGDCGEPAPVQVTGLTNIAGVTALRLHTCAWKLDGTAWCWGSNGFGGLGDGTKKSTTEPVQVQGLANPAALAAGSGFSCALEDSGSVWCWGRNDHGQLGNGSQTDESAPVQAAGLVDIVHVTAGSSHTCALKSDDSVWCWGKNSASQLGNGSQADELTPVQVVDLANVVGLAAGWSHTCAVKGDGTLWCWGANDGGQVGDGTTDNRNTPVQVVGVENIVAVQAGYGYTCALTGTGSLWCWGRNDEGQLGVGSISEPILSPAGVADAGGVTVAAAGGSHTCVLRQDGTVWCFGANKWGELGNGLGGIKNYKAEPVQVPLVSDVAGIAAASNHTCAWQSGGPAWCWGGLNTTPYYPQSSNDKLGCGDCYGGQTVPMEVVGLTSVASVAVGESHSCAVADDSSAWCWGNASFGKLGTGSDENEFSPAQVVGLGGSLAAVAAATRHTCALKEEGTVWCWGNNGFGELGQGDFAPYPAPVQVVGLEDAVALSARHTHTCGLKADGTAWCWGSNCYGQMGNGEDGCNVAPNPIQFADFAGVTAVAAGSSFTCVSKADGTAWCSGVNDGGQLGDGTNENSTTPVPVVGLAGVSTVAAGSDQVCALMTDGSVSCWGTGYYPGYAVGPSCWPLEDQSMPMLVDDLVDITSLSAGSRYTCAVKADGTLWCWGASSSGQLGDGALWTPFPVQVVGLP